MIHSLNEPSSFTIAHPFLMNLVLGERLVGLFGLAFSLTGELGVVLSNLLGATSKGNLPLVGVLHAGDEAAVGSGGAGAGPGFRNAFSES